ncbi:MAG TPA: rod shape-determining protein MreC [Nitriliruptorales bacterium]|nr:rod shape-determining protein MreC [Nitriliruptorales bacterium]
MYDRRRARVLLAVLTLVSLALITIDERAGEDGPLSRARDGVATIFAPVQDGLATVVRPVGGLFAGIRDVVRLRDENARLQAELERLRERRRSLDDVVRENESLKGLLEQREELTAASEEHSFFAAEVVALAPSSFAEWTVTIDAGTRDGVQKDMTVIDGDGLVGRVVQSGPSHSRVLLAIDQNFAAAARIAESGEHGVLEGGDTEPMAFELLNPEADVRVGDEVVTSTYGNATFPDGIPVGAVSKVDKPTPSLSRTVDVQPFVDFTQLDVVLVILRAPPPDPDPLPIPGSEPSARPSPGDAVVPGGAPATPPATLPPTVEPDR